MAVVKPVVLIAAAALLLSAPGCGSTLGLIGAATPAEAAKRWVDALDRQDADAARALRCDHGWSGPHYISMIRLAGRHRLTADVQKMRRSWSVTISAIYRYGGSTSMTVKVVREYGGYVVCGFIQP
jgi:hypothetical protein